MRSENNEKELKTAVALEYNISDEAPKILAVGKGALAEKIIGAAHEADIPVHEDAKLAKTLSKLDIGDYIPPELYEVVAEVLVFVDKVEKLKNDIRK